MRGDLLDVETTRKTGKLTFSTKKLSPNPKYLELARFESRLRDDKNAYDKLTDDLKLDPVFGGVFALLSVSYNPYSYVNHSIDSYVPKKVREDDKFGRELAKIAVSKNRYMYYSVPKKFRDTMNLVEIHTDSEIMH